jgi:hypothetical protein
MNQFIDDAAGQNDARAAMERVCRSWGDAIAASDISSLVNLYATDAEIESPLICEYTGSKTGVLHGRKAFRSIYEAVAQRQSKVIRPRHHDDYLICGRRIIWEYPRVTPSGDQSEFVEAWDFNERYEIQCHRVYWG